MKTYKGACHCGEVQYEIQADLTSAIECNCSMCAKKGTVLAFVSPDKFKLVSGQTALTNYQFHKKVIDHNFCKYCGVTSFLSGHDGSGKHLKAINVRCLEGVDLKTLEIKQVDGRSF